jgi:hypothetical protein
MKKSAKLKKPRGGLRRRDLAPILRGELPILRAKPPKKRPRGKPFVKGHSIGAAFRFTKGNNANPGGRPKFAEVSKAARAFLATEIEGDPRERTYAEAIVETLGTQALLGDRGCASELIDRAEGKPRQAVELDQRDPLAELLQEMREESKRVGPPEEMPEAALLPTAEETAVEETLQ